ncbi:hypothetical protein HYY74_00205 [Candidatus Woesearchaeota archaeon]|nr:hypothetical protein [Candidatus Woesearchaeota archaeon]
MLGFILLALFLGFKHSFDADHLLAVSTLLPKASSIRHAFLMGLMWAFGHMVTAIAVTFLLFSFRDFLSPVLEKFELLVALMLVGLGAISILQSGIVHAHRHRHEKAEHAHVHEKGFHHVHRQMFGVGIIHGLASNDELLVLITATLGVSTFALAALGVAIFTAGVVAGMAVFSMLLAYPLVRARQEALLKGFYLISGLLSIGYGLWMLAALVF